MTRFRKPSLRALLIGGALCAAAPASAQPEPVVLDTITLVSTGLPTGVMESPAAVTVIGPEEIARAAPTSVAGLLADVPGLQVFEEGIERIAIRGEESRRIAILIDGQKLTDHTNYGQPVLVDPTTIERIEVLRGASSVVSGSRAIGGVINIVTKRGAEKPFALSVTGGYLSATRGYRLSATAAGTLQMGAGALDYRLSLGRMEQNDRHTPRRVLEPSDINDRNLSGHLGYRLGQHYFGLKGQAYDLQANVHIDEDDFTLSLPRRDLRKLSAFYEGTDLTPWLDRLSVDVYRQGIARDFWTRVGSATGPVRVDVLAQSSDDQDTHGLNLRAEMRFSDHSRTLAGLEYEDDGLDTDKLTTTRISMGGMPVGGSVTHRHDRASLRTLSIFAQHEITFDHGLTATFGARWYDVSARHEASSTDGRPNPTSSNGDNLLLGSAGLVWSPDPSLAFRANISQGYIYPTLGQLFLTTAAGSDGTIIGNPDLKPETSTTFELGARYDTGATVIDATLFHSNSRDYIARVTTGPRSFSYANVESARATGLEIVAEHRPQTWGLTPYGSATVMRREMEYGNGYSTADSGTPRLAARIGLRRDWQAGDIDGTLDLFVLGESAVELRGDDGAISGSAAGYATLNMRGAVDFGNGLHMVAELVNLTDRIYQPYERMEGPERSLNLYLTRNF